MPTKTSALQTTTILLPLPKGTRGLKFNRTTLLVPALPGRPLEKTQHPEAGVGSGCQRSSGASPIAISKHRMPFS